MFAFNTYHSIFFPIILLWLTTNFLFWLIDLYRKSKQLSSIRSPPTSFLLGNLDYVVAKAIKHKNISEWSKDGLDMLVSWTKEYSSDGFMRFNIGPFGSRVIIATHPDTVELILGPRGQLDKAREYDILKCYLGNSLLTRQADEWKTRRKMLNKTFGFPILEKFLPIFERQIAVFMSVIEKDADKQGKIKDVRKMLGMYILDTLCETAMGYQLKCQTESTEPQFLVDVKRLLELLAQVFIRPWYWIRPITRMTPLGKEIRRLATSVHSFTNRVIRDRRSDLLSRINVESSKSAIQQLEDEETGQKHQFAFLDLLLSMQINDPNCLNDIDLRTEVDVFMFGGYHTTASSLPLTLHLIGCHSKVQRKIQEEVDQLFPDPVPKLSLEALRKMKYTEAVVKESLRLFPPITLMGRLCTEPVKFGSHVIPAGTSVAICAYQIHRLEEFFPNPDEFNPDRFLNSIDKQKHPYAFLGFSGGPRNCIGQKYAMIQQKAVIATILKKYNVESLQSTNDIKLALDITLLSKSEIGVRFLRKKIGKMST